MKKLILLFACLLGMLPAHAGDATMKWDANTEADLAGYRIHYGTASGAYTTTADAGLVVTMTVTGLAEGATYFFAVTAYNDAGLKSLYSNEVAYTVPMPQLALKIDYAGKKLTWTDNAEPTPPQIANYLVERAGQDGAWLWSQVVAAKEMPLPALPGGTYTFRVSVMGYRGAYSNTVQISVPKKPATPRIRIAMMVATDLADWAEVASYTPPEEMTRVQARLAFVEIPE